MPRRPIQRPPGFHPGTFSAVPTGLICFLSLTQDCVLGYSQPSYGTDLFSVANPGLHPGPFSAVPTGLIRFPSHTQDCVMGYSQPSYGTDLFSVANPGLHPGT